MKPIPHPLPCLKKAKRTSALFLRLIALCSMTLLGGCSHIVLFDPKGPVGDTERFVITTAFVLMLIVVIPVFVMAFWFPWKYRASNLSAEYRPKWRYSGKIEFVIWLVPAVIVTGLGILTWNTTHRLDPYKTLESSVEPLTIEAVSLDWKWLFIYPDHDIAVVNELVFPANVPLNFKITSDTVMTSFFIPQLGSQIYAMAGMQTKLHLLADEPGTFFGQNQQFSGSGYSEMRFKAIAVTDEQFAAWLKQSRNVAEKLDLAGYEALIQPTSGYPVTYFSSVQSGLFEHIIGKYHKSKGKDHGGHSRNGGSNLPTLNMAVLEGN